MWYGSDAGYFHEGKPDNHFQLPVLMTYGSCVATPSLTGAAQDRSSWDHISYVVSQMAAICSVGQVSGRVDRRRHLCKIFGQDSSDAGAGVGDVSQQR